MKTLSYLLLIVIGMIAMIQNVNAQTIFRVISDDTLSDNRGGRFCFSELPDSIPFYDHSGEYETSHGGQLIKWEWVFNGAVDTTLVYTSFRPVVYAKWLHPGKYRVRLYVTTLWNGGPYYNVNAIDIGIILGGSKIRLQNHIEYLNGNKVTLKAKNLFSDTMVQAHDYYWGKPIIDSGWIVPSYYRWSKNGVVLSQGYNDSELITTDTGTYVVLCNHAYDGYDCSSYDTVVVLKGILTSINAISDQQSSIVIYPNPAQNFITIKGAETEEVRIIDLSGKEVLTAKNIGKIDISNLSAGMYIISCGDHKSRLVITH